MKPSRPRIHIVYEYGIDFRPHSSPYLRLIQPFTHPRAAVHLDTVFDMTYRSQPADLVILERLWRPDVSLPHAQQLVENIRLSSAKFIYSLDDNFFDLVLENKGWPPPEFLPIVEFCMRQADGVMVSTPALRQRLLEYNPHIAVVPNALDERLLISRCPARNIHFSDARRRVVVGCMGTLTHDEDLLLILPALQAVCRRHPGQVEIQLLGVTRSLHTRAALDGLPARYINLPAEEAEYPLFMPWYTARMHWDIALSPLRQTPFNDTKSDIKFLDYAAIGAAGIFSDLLPYQDTVQHLENGWLAENTPAAWEEALETLITSPDLRQHIATQAYAYLYRQRILAHRAGDWLSTIYDFLGEQ
ncbi:MAG: glycosyltransferase [Anaerolineales bacterium]|nr:glycosyltransferase [Anaerolineales bacterium]